MRKKLTNIFWNIEVWAVQKHVNLVDLVKSFPTNIYLQNLASIQKRTSPVKFAHLAEKSENGSISNLSTKVGLGRAPRHARRRRRLALDLAALGGARLSTFKIEFRNKCTFSADNELLNSSQLSQRTFCKMKVQSRFWRISGWMKLVANC